MPVSTTLPDPRPTLVYDGDCGICKCWVDYWAALTGPQVSYRRYQDAAADFPGIAPDAFRNSIQLIEPDGKVYAGAAATFRILRLAPGRRAWWWLYARIPPFAMVAEWSYAFFARRRGLLHHLTRLLWGMPLLPERHDLATWLFLRGLGLVYLAAFASVAVQITGLVGSAGILPLQSWLNTVRDQTGGAAWFELPTLFWLDAGDAALVAGAVAGMVLALLVVIGRMVRSALAGAFVLYLSYFHAGQDFMMFQWDLLLLEAGFLAMFLPGGSRIVIWLFRWLAFRFMFMAGAVKLLSGDPTWRDLTALQYHFETQPLPTPLAWYAAQLPHWLLAGGTAATLAIEVGVVFLAFAPRRPRAIAAVSVLALEILIALTGNYNFFNLLTMLLCVFLLDDAALQRLVPARLAARIAARSGQPGRAATAFAAALALIVVPIGINRVWLLFADEGIPVADSLTGLTSPLCIVNSYGLFAVMTTTRPEVVVEGSADGRTWREYEFRYQPGTQTRRPSWNIPHQPRLDWNLWFAALGGTWELPWFNNFLLRLLQGSRPVLALIAVDPFPEHPPRYVRATLYDYRYADPATHAATGQWWVRRRLREFSPVVSLPDGGTRADDGSSHRKD